MELQKLLQDIAVQKVIGDTNSVIESLSQDSRDDSFRSGMYFAIQGTQVDGHDFIPDVIEKGAVAVVCEYAPELIHDDVAYIVVNDARIAMGGIASCFYGHPSQDINIVAVTGTNGKTSVATFITQSLEYLGNSTLLLSTAGDRFKGELITLDRKAPSSLETIELHRVLGEYRDQGAQYCCLEATSIGLDQYRLSGLDINVAIFTNLADDHLDYHGTVQKYAEAKKGLFDTLSKNAFAITNGDDEYGNYMIQDTLASVSTYGQSSSIYTFKYQGSTLSGMQLHINGNEINVPVIGEFNAYNITATYACLGHIGFDQEKIITALSNISGVPGRMQMVHNERNIMSIVDYAHSADALKNVLTMLQNIPHNNIITVIGCGGDRDRTKRAPMAQVTQLLSDVAIYTADNPRTESLDQIFADMEQGVDISRSNYEFISSREEAIKSAVQQAREKDIVLVAGKGHEDYQIIGTEKKHFDDTEILEKYLAPIGI